MEIKKPTSLAAGGFEIKEVYFIVKPNRWRALYSATLPCAKSPA